jgi:hypothetical protein
MLSYRANFDTLRSATTAAIGTNYATIGSASSYPIVIVNFKNFTNGDVVVSTDASIDMLYIPSNSFSLYDIRTNASFNTDFVFPIGTQFYVKDGSTIGTTGTFYIETVVAKQILGGP